MKVIPGNPLLVVAGIVAITWVLLMPPLFTGGACQREFETEAKRIESDRQALSTMAKAREYWIARGTQFLVLPVDQCRRSRRAFIDRCGPGPLIYVRVPVENVVCRFYRDDAITVQLHYTEKAALSVVQVDMSPFKSLPLPFDMTLHWAR